MVLKIAYTHNTGDSGRTNFIKLNLEVEITKRVDHDRRQQRPVEIVVENVHLWISRVQGNSKDVNGSSVLASLFCEISGSRGRNQN